MSFDFDFWKITLSPASNRDVDDIKEIQINARHRHGEPRFVQPFELKSYEVD